MWDEAATGWKRFGSVRSVRVWWVLLLMSVPVIGFAEEQTTGTLSLSELFGAGEPETPALPTRDTPEAELNQMIAGLGDMLNEADRPRLFELTERLLTLLHPSDPRWAETLSHRAAGMLRENQHEQFRRLAKSYLDAAPRGPRAPWMLEQRARLAASEKQWNESASDWAAALTLIDDSMTTLPMQMVLPALESLSRGARAEDAVQLSRRISWEHCSPSESDLAMLWLLDAHLQNDRITTPPPAQESRNDSVLLRQALLAFRDERFADAQAIAARIDARRLSDTEAAVHQRLFSEDAAPISILSEEPDVR